MKTTVTIEDVKKNMQDVLCETRVEFGKPTTYVTVKMANGFTLRESTTCVDPANYDESIGREICLSKIEDKIWFLLGYKLQDDLHMNSVISGVLAQWKEADPFIKKHSDGLYEINTGSSKAYANKKAVEEIDKSFKEAIKNWKSLTGPVKEARLKSEKDYQSEGAIKLCEEPKSTWMEWGPNNFGFNKSGHVRITSDGKIQVEAKRGCDQDIDKTPKIDLNKERKELKIYIDALFMAHRIYFTYDPKTSAIMVERIKRVLDEFYPHIKMKYTNSSIEIV